MYKNVLASGIQQINVLFNTKTKNKKKDNNKQNLTMNFVNKNEKMRNKTNQ